MLKIASSIDYSQQFPAKCGEIFLQSFADLIIYCSFCDIKVLAMDEFLQHLQNNHFGKNSHNNQQILQDYDELEEEEILEEQWLESFKAEDESVPGASASAYQENYDEEECLDNYREQEVKEEKEESSSNEEYLNNATNNTTKVFDWEMISDKEEYSSDEEYLGMDRKQTTEEFESSENEDNDKLSKYKKEKTPHKSSAKSKKSSKKPVEYNCTECQKTFNLLCLLDDHLVEHHGGLKCSICNKRFKKRHHLTRHKLTHNTERKYSCPIAGCGKTFVILDYCKHHMRTCHANSESEAGDNSCAPKRYVCDQCGHSCTTSFSLKVHLRLHTGEKPFKCDFCEKSYISNSSLRNHMVSHKTIRNFICNICQAAFKSNRSLKNHQLVHSEERKFKCELCEAAFKQPYGLLQHVQYVHKGKKDTRVRRNRNSKTVSV